MKEISHRRLQHGDRFVPAGLLNAHSAQLEALASPVLPNGTVGPDGQMVLPPPPGVAGETLLVKITAKDGSTPPAYSWERILEGGAGIPSTHPDAGYVNGVPASYPAYELNGNPNVPLNAAVRLFPAVGQEYWWFSWHPLSGTVPGNVTYTGDLTFASGSDSVYQSGSTATFQSGSSLTLNSGSTLTTAATVSVTGGTWTYGSTASAGTAPTSRLVIPTLTGGAWPPTYIGTFGEVICGGDKFGQYTGSTWVSYYPNPLTTKGDLQVALAGGTPSRLPVGTDGYLLKADSTQTTGLAYVDPATLSAALPTSPPAVTLGGTPTLSTAPQWFKVTGISRTDFSTAGITRTITALVLPAKGVVHKAVVKTSAAFTGGAITAYKIDVKVNGNTVISVYDAFAAPSSTNFGSASEGNASAYLGKPWNFGATVNVELTATSTGANLNAATAGALDLWLELSKLE